MNRKNRQKCSMISAAKCLMFFMMIVAVHTGLCQDSLTLREIFVNGSFDVPELVDEIHWLKNKSEYCTIAHNVKGNVEIVKKNIITSKKIKTICPAAWLMKSDDTTQISIDAFQISENENLLLFSTQTIPIYRRSRKSIYYYIDIKTKKLLPLKDTHHVSNATISPDGTTIAYVFENNLYFLDTKSGNHTAITSNGKKNSIINGMTDWVYEEEFEFTQAYFWNATGEYIAFYEFDESHVKQYTMQLWNNDSYPVNYTYKYPKAGERNATIKVMVYHVPRATMTTAFDFSSYDNYVPRIGWTSHEHVLSVRELNRSQDTMHILHYHVVRQDYDTLLTFAEPGYIEVNDDFYYIKNLLIFTSETSGYRHISAFDWVNKKYFNITSGHFEVSHICRIDTLKKKIFYISNEQNSTQKHLYSIGFDGKNKIKLTSFPGTNDANIHPSCHSGVIYHHSSLNPPSAIIYDFNNNAIVKRVSVAESYINNCKKHLSEVQIKTYVNPNNDTLNYWIMKPQNNSKPCPLLLYVYGGPGSQEVLDEWPDKRMLWHHFLVKQGFAVACVDNRGTGGKGAYHKKCTTMQLGKLESEDQINFAKYLGRQEGIDSSRVGIWGWSFGGYLSTLCLLLGNEVFKLAIAVAPVTSWRFYDTIYTERFLKTPQENPSGYDDYSPAMLAGKLRGKYMLVHGTADDNVHVQNAFAMQKALINEGKAFDTFLYPDKAHSISGAKTRLHLFEMLTKYFIKQL